MLFFVCITAFSFQLSAAERQQKFNTYQDVQKQFAQPPLFYAPHTFWFWDAPLDSKLAASMAWEISRQRLNPGYTHARRSCALNSSYPKLPFEQ